MNRIELFKQHLNEKRAVKVIAGIDNFDVENVKKVVAAATQAGASAIDISASEEILTAARELTELPLFVSSVIPEELASAVANGADAIELGNFDALYKKGIKMGADEILELARRTMSLINKSEVFFCVTVPGHISVAEQIDLARKLEELGVDMLQTEGSAIADVKSEGARGLMETAEVSIANTIELVRNVDIPVMTASGITPTTAAFAFAAGASAIGVGSCINKVESSIAMVAVARSLVEIAAKNAQREMIMA
jgi:2-keto-3-deoxy-6-phosphogluconate aldolase